MTEETENADRTRRWLTKDLSGLGTTLETLMELQAILNETIGYHAAFEQKHHSFTGRHELPADKMASLAKQVQRVTELRDATRQEFINLGEALVWCGFAVDDLEEYSRQHSQGMAGLRTSGFDRKNMIKFGREIVALLRRSQSAMASVHLTTFSLRQPLYEVTDSFSESEELAYEYLDNLTTWVSEDVDRIRDLCRAYSVELDILEQQELNKSKLKAS